MIRFSNWSINPEEIVCIESCDSQRTDGYPYRLRVKTKDGTSYAADYQDRAQRDRQTERLINGFDAARSDTLPPSDEHIRWIIKGEVDKLRPYLRRIERLVSEAPMNEQKLERCPRYVCDLCLLRTSNDKCLSGGVDECLKDGRYTLFQERTPLPDSKALTVEELREMDGEPVYIVCDPDADGEQLVMWALVEVDADGGEVYLTNNLGGRTEFLHSEDFDGMHIYRRPPEKGE